MTNSTTDASDKMPNEIYLGPALLKTESKEDFAKLLEDLNRNHPVSTAGTELAPFKRDGTILRTLACQSLRRG